MTAPGLHSSNGSDLQAVARWNMCAAQIRQDCLTRLSRRFLGRGKGNQLRMFHFAEWQERGAVHFHVTVLLSDLDQRRVGRTHTALKAAVRETVRAARTVDKLSGEVMAFGPQVSVKVREVSPGKLAGLRDNGIRYLSKELGRDYADKVDSQRVNELQRAVGLQPDASPQQVKKFGFSGQVWGQTRTWRTASPEKEMPIPSDSLDCLSIVKEMPTSRILSKEKHNYGAVSFTSEIDRYVELAVHLKVSEDHIRRCFRASSATSYHPSDTDSINAFS